MLMIDGGGGVNAAAAAAAAEAQRRRAAEAARKAAEEARRKAEEEARRKAEAAKRAAEAAAKAKAEAEAKAKAAAEAQKKAEAAAKQTKELPGGLKHEGQEIESAAKAEAAKQAKAAAEAQKKAEAAALHAEAAKQASAKAQDDVTKAQQAEVTAKAVETVEKKDNGAASNERDDVIATIKADVAKAKTGDLGDAGRKMDDKLPWADQAVDDAIQSQVGYQQALNSAKDMTADDVSQADAKNTCAAAKVQEALAEKDPFALQELAQNLVEGKGASIKGQNLSVSDENRAAIEEAYGHDPAGWVNALVQTALMEHAAGEGGTYDFKTDRINLKDAPPPFLGGADAAPQTGLTVDQQQRLDSLGVTETRTAKEITSDIASALKHQSLGEKVGGTIKGWFTHHDERRKDATEDVLKKALSSAGSDVDVVVNLKVSDDQVDGHTYKIDRINDGNVYLKDGSGNETKISAEDFGKRLMKDDGHTGENTSATTGFSLPSLLGGRGR